MAISVAVAGSTGRLGSLICDVIEEDPRFELVARLRSSSAPDEGADAEVLVDVTTPDASQAVVERALRRGQKVIVGTSGWSQERLAELDTLISEISGAGAIVVPNFSLGSVLGTALAQIAAPFFDSIEIIESHHAKKVDSPSGTAVRTAELMMAARGGNPVEAPYAEQTARGELIGGIPVHSLRMTGVMAKQEVRMGGAGEVLTVTHDTLSGDSYKAGIRAALAAAPEATGLTVGLDVLLGLGKVGA
ncbi:4-hydroxy-tetrahydrodipicolinate reductase [Leucobacter sp. cx-42]|uniref:4-hydroxy-tetrahydrodipicolinate reductase n=1 Tax=unclassified Leucobacter TaxID=2621730 RepID=UPI00165DE948|nr:MULTISPECIES: 4-hydroxy-tetrahydrodipicolinate reductase [unclassified Leucobacter]MBC9954258.1 4-hydroxy-tetrahydrodipicolinate reductase [Leucobacter sp. cx-42]